MYPRSYAQYTLLERLATGGMSEVDLARRTVDDAGYVRFLVVKRIKADMVEDAAFVRMFKDEARITSELRHTNIAQVYDFGRVGDEYFLALEYVPGTDLRAVLTALRTQRKRMPVRMVLRVASDVLGALHYAHTRTDALGKPMQVVHRDVNPRNIMLAVSGEVKLIDFGVARASDRLERTQTDHFKGKIAYMAPEQVTGGDLDHRVDVFAMGLTLYEMLTGRGAFTGLDQTQILYRILQGQLPRLDVPREWGAPGRALTDLVARALAHDPADRFPTAEVMREAVHRTAQAFGGMPSQGEVAAWLAEVQPDLDERVREKMARLSGPLPPLTDMEEDPAEARTEPLPEEGSGTLTRGGTGTLTAPVVVAAGLGTATLAALVLAFLLLVGVGVVGTVAAWPWLVAPTAAPRPLDDGFVDGTSGAAPSDSDVPGVVRPLQVTPPAQTSVDAGAVPVSGESEAARPESAHDPDPTGGPTGTGTGTGTESDAPTGTGTESDTSTGTGTESDAPTGTGTESDAPTGTGTESDGPTGTPPAGSVETVTSTPEATPDPDPNPDPEDLPTGQLQVTAAQKGLIIYIDGQPTPYRTGEQFSWPIGTHTVSADGLAPATVEVKAGLFAFVPLKPE